MDIKEGPTEIVIRQDHCGSCKHHHSLMVRSGRDPWRKHYCQHPIAGGNFEIKFSWEPEGRAMGKTDIAPHWCPVKRQA